VDDSGRMMFGTVIVPISASGCRSPVCSEVAASSDSESNTSMGKSGALGGPSSGNALRSKQGFIISIRRCLVPLLSPRR
jgi:hypothetical protein